MSEIKIEIEGEFEKLSGPGSRSLNKLLSSVLNIVATEIAEDIERKAKEYARGIDTPEQRVPNQAGHSIGKSESGYPLTGKLESGITLFSHGKARVTITSSAKESSYLEWGTGIYGDYGKPIVPTKGKALKFTTPSFGTQVVASVEGQRPNPFLRSSIWYTIDNISPTINRIQSILDKL